MPNIISKNKKKERLSFFVNLELSEKINLISKQTKLTASEIARNALQEYLDKVEKEKIEAELKAGYKANYDYYVLSFNWLRIKWATSARDIIFVRM